MINVSREFQKLMQERTDFKERADVTLADGTILNLSASNFTVSNNSITDGADYNGLPLGAAISKHIQIEIMNDADQYSQYDFFGAKIRLYLTYQLSDSVETIEKGTYTVIEPETYGTTVIITAVDDMYKANKQYSTSITFPATAGAVLRDICSKCDILLRSTSFYNADFVIQTMPSADYTFRQIIGYIAMISGGNARIDRFGYLEILNYDKEAFTDLDNYLNGGIYQPWNTGDNADGGNFAPWNIGDVVDGGNFTDWGQYHQLKNWKNLKIDTDDVVITGVKTTVDDVEYMNGIDGYVLSVENPLIAGSEQTVIDYLGGIYVGMRFRKFEGDLVANPMIEFMDPAVLVDRKGNMYRTYITDVDFTFFGFTVLKNSAENAVRNSSSFYSEATKALIKSKELVEKEKTDRELAVEQLANQLAHSSGLFMTESVQPDLSVIYYMHDKPTLAESMIIWKLTALAFAVSTDGGRTYPYGFTVDGTTITRILYAEGIDADYINAGAINISDGNGKELFYADYDTKQVRVNADNVMIDSKNVQAYIDEALISATNEIRLEVTERTSIYNEEVNTLQGGMDGYINLVFWDGYLEKSIIGGKECLYCNTYFSQSVSIPSGTYLFSYEWYLNGQSDTSISLFMYKDDLLTDKIYSKYFYNVNEFGEWKQETFQFTLTETRRMRIYVSFIGDPQDPEKINNLYLTNIAMYGTAQSVADAVADVKAELMIQSDEISAKVDKDGVITAINLSPGTAVINSAKIDLIGLVNATEFTTKFATIQTLNTTTANLENLIAGKASVEQLNATSANLQNLISEKASIAQLNAQEARINSIDADYVSAGTLNAEVADISGRINAQEARINSIDADYISSDTVYADFMEVANWTSAGHIKADRIDVNELFARTSIGSTTANFLSLSFVHLSDSFGTSFPAYWRYSDTLHGYVLMAGSDT